MELLEAILESLRDPTVPSHRVFRKAAAISMALILALIYYRHIERGFGFGEPALVTIMLAFMIFAIIGIFGGMMSAGFYDSFLNAVGAQERKPTIVTFFAEWLFALTAPLLGVLLYVFLGSRDAIF